MAGLIRKCRTDFGIDIEIDLSHLRPNKETGKTERHCAIGIIRYDHVEPSAPVGTLIYIKPSLTGDESSDIRHYADSHADFPHQPTLDQFFNESQFESYRALGYHVAHEVLGEVIAKLGRQKFLDDTNVVTQPGGTSPDVPKTNKNVQQSHAAFVGNLVYWIQKYWLPKPAGFETSFLESVKPFVELHQNLQSDPSLQHISRDLYPEIPITPVPGATTAATAATPVLAGTPTQVGAGQPEELHVLMQMLQVMENAWIGMRINEYHAHPLNAGWMNLFQRWSNTNLFRRYWHVVRHEFSREFVQFCERELSAKFPADKLEFFDSLPPTEQESLFAEFDREWPEEKCATWKEGQRPVDRSLKALHKQSVRYQVGDTKRNAFWVIRNYSEFESPPGDNGVPPVVAGVIGLRNLPDDERPDSRSDHTNNYELVVWVRPAFRQQQIGQTMFERFCFGIFLSDDGKAKGPLLSQLGSNPLVALFYPQKSWTGAGAKLSKRLWLSYFSFYQFRRPKADESWPQAGAYEILYWPAWVYSQLH